MEIASEVLTPWWDRGGKSQVASASPASHLQRGFSLCGDEGLLLAKTRGEEFFLFNFFPLATLTQLLPFFCKRTTEKIGSFSQKNRAQSYCWLRSTFVIINRCCAPVSKAVSEGAAANASTSIPRGLRKV